MTSTQRSLTCRSLVPRGLPECLVAPRTSLSPPNRPDPSTRSAPHWSVPKPSSTRASRGRLLILNPFLPLSVGSLSPTQARYFRPPGRSLTPHRSRVRHRPLRPALHPDVPIDPRPPSRTHDPLLGQEIDLVEGRDPKRRVFPTLLSHVVTRDSWERTLWERADL